MWGLVSAAQSLLYKAVLGPDRASCEHLQKQRYLSIGAKAAGAKAAAQPMVRSRIALDWYIFLVTAGRHGCV